MAEEPHSQETITGLKHDLVAQHVPIEKRFRSLFTLRGIGTKEAVDAMACGVLVCQMAIWGVSILYVTTALDDPSALLRHEVAYCLGQMGDKHAFPILCEVLAKTGEHPMVRHEVSDYNFITNIMQGRALIPFYNPRLLKLLGRLHTLKLSPYLKNLRMTQHGRCVYLKAQHSPLTLW
jgi:hypothetical protein